MGLGALPASSEQWLGMLGMHGTFEANMAMNKADLIVALGARFDDRVTGRLDAFAPHSKKIHVDIDRSSVNKNVRRSEEHTSELQSLMSISYAVFCLKKKNKYTIKYKNIIYRQQYN